jgi:hypothetical protein
MSRIVYLGFPTGEVAGGQKMILRHVETLRDLGFEAVFWRGESNVMPEWMAHSAPVEVATPFRPDDLLVLPSDAPNAIRQTARLPNSVVVFCQNQYSFATIGLEAVDRLGDRRPLTFMTPGRLCGEAVQRLYPAAAIEVVPCFVDERIFRRGEAAGPAVAYSPRKRRMEAQGIRGFLGKLRPEHAGLAWTRIENAHETEVARLLAASGLFLSLSRFESVGMTPLEAMASGCVCAGFTGLGGREYASEANGFWAPEDDLEAAAEALGRAADLALGGGAALAAYREAAAATARQWSYANFRLALEETWMRLAPKARRRAGPLDA